MEDAPIVTSWRDNELGAQMKIRSCWQATFGLLAACLASLAQGEPPGSIYFPVAYSGSVEHPRNIVKFFWSPSCTLCATTFKNAIGPLMLENGEDGPDLVIMYLFPRSDEDLQRAEILACVPPEKYSSFSTAWLLASTLEIGTLEGMLAMARKYGSTAQGISECANDQAKAAAFGIRKEAVSRWNIVRTPGIVVNDKLLEHVYFSWQLKEALIR